MEAKKKKQIKADQLSLELWYPLKKDTRVNMCSAGAVASEENARARLQE